MKISDSNPVQYWLAGKETFNERSIYGIDKKLFNQPFLSSAVIRTDVKFDRRSSPTWDSTKVYNTGDTSYSTSTGLKYRSVVDGNVGNDPNQLPWVAYLGVNWTLDTFTIVLGSKGPTNIDTWQDDVTYSIGDRAFSDGSATLPFVFESLVDGNLNIDPATFGALGVTWKIVVELPDQNKLIGSTDESVMLWYSTKEYKFGDLVYLLATGLKYRSIEDGNTGNDPALFAGHWVLATYRADYSDDPIYATGDEVFGGDGPTGFVYRSLQDGNTSNNPEASLGVWWEVVTESRGVYEFDFSNVNQVDTNQKAVVDLSLYPELVGKLLRLTIFNQTQNPLIAAPSTWIDISGAWTTKTSGEFTKNGLVDGSSVSSYMHFSPLSPPLYGSMLVNSGQRLTMRYKIAINGTYDGTVSVRFIATDDTDGSVCDQVYSLGPDFGPEFAHGDITITETMVLSSPSVRLQILVEATMASGSAAIVISEITGINQIMTELAKSDCLSIVESMNAPVELLYTNKTDFDDMAYRDIHPVNALRIEAHFWEEDDPQTGEDYDDSKGTVISLREQIRHKRKLSTSFLPAYMHKKIRHILMHDVVVIDSIRYRREDDYTPLPIDRSTIYSASVWLTERSSVLVNIGANMEIEDRIFDDTFGPEFP